MKKVLSFFVITAVVAIGFVGWGKLNTQAAVSTTPSADLAITMTKAIGNATDNPSVAAYAITVKNLGPSTSTDVAVRDTLLPPLTLGSVNFTDPSNGFYDRTTGTWTIFTLPAGSSETLNLVANFEADPGTTIINTATVDATSTTDPNITNNTASASFVVPPSADLAITKTVDNSNPVPGTTVNYVLTVSALGPSSSTGVSVSDLLPAGLTFMNSTSSVGSYDAASGIWTIGDMTPSSSATLHIGATVNASDFSGQIINNTALAGESASVSDPNPKNNSAWVNITVTPLSDLVVAKTVDNAAPMTGDTVNYTVTVSNLGPSTATGVKINDMLPAGLSFESAHTTQGYYVAHGYHYIAGGVWTVGNLAVNASATLKIAALVNASSGTTIVNTASTGGVIDPNPTNNTSSASIFVGDVTTSTTNVAGLEIMNVVDNTNPLPSSTVNYTLTVSALGPATSTGVTVSDPLPTGLTFVDSTSSVGSYDATSGIWTIGDMSASSSATLTIGTTVDPSDTAGQSIVNIATARESAIDTNPDAANASSSATITIGTNGGGTPSADLAVSKTVDNANPQAGSTVNYTITATDLGPATSTEVTVNDPLPAGLVLTGATSSTGTYDAATGVWTVGDLAASSSATLHIAAMVDAAETAGLIIANTATGNESSSVNDPNMANNVSSVNIAIKVSHVTPQSISIGQNGDFTGRGMIVTSVSSSSFQATVWGTSYTVNFDANNSSSNNDEGDSFNASSQQILGSLVPGDVVDISGTVTSTAPLVVNARSVRKVNDQNPRPSENENDD